MKTLLKHLVYLLIFCLYACSSHQGIPIRIAKYKGDRTCAISYTYDDGYKEHYTLVAPQMEKYNLRGTFWINGISVGKDTARVTWAQLKEMANSGHEISNHTWSHPNLTQVSTERIRREIEKNDSIILAEIGIPSQTFCYPYNAINEDAVRIASEGRIATRLKQYTMGTPSTPEKLSNWVNVLLATEDWGIGMMHGLTYGYDAFTSNDILWNHFEEVAAQKDRIWVGTFREVAAYTKERDYITLNARKNGKTLIVTPELLLDKALFTEPLTMVIDKANIQNITVEQGGNKLAVRVLADKAMFDFKPDGGEIKITL